MATQQVALKSEGKTQSLLDKAPNYLVRCVIQKRNNKSVWDFKLHFVDN